ncbi:succinate--CoA ligase subunit beta [Thiocapsa imhoffii]|uniref:Succinate--CoA ligase [ADP-forming] subunit beta n=1 Tax=Thiocapsa imhoffii TaxID=382777 RepID=A0A9X0WGK5_9GAMM|nr:ADP-forming succinate--CoA ligase subunit beta [Thiocapsa imhoffii]MBK1644292.1 succinate--CoA ligase subunit beta [Thiocapsa imhoffii]
MNLHEYQAKGLFREYGIPVPDGRAVRSVEAATDACRQLGGERWLVKAQIHAGGRGKAGGVVMAETPAAVEAAARRLLGQRLVTAQTTAEGRPVDWVLIERPIAIAREFYLGLLLERETERLLFVGSAAGGVDIERTAAENPERLVRVRLHPAVGLQPYQVRRLGFELGLNQDQRTALGQLLASLYRLLIDTDASLIEINPLVVTEAGALIALDAKITLDDNALYRHPERRLHQDPSQEDPRELAAQQHGLNYIALTGNIGCMVNGAGLAMATMDLVKWHGGAPANFLDVGGGTTAARVTEAFKLILSERQVRAVLVNIFGGIVRCDLIAEGLIEAVREARVAVPLVVRLEGTNAREGLSMLAESGLALETVASLDEAARRVVAAAAAASATVDGGPS